MDRRLETFLAVCQTMHYRRAAEALHLTQPAVTKQIQKLERALAMELFDRSRRPMALTEEAIVLRREAHECRERLQAAARELQQRSYIKPILRIGAIDLLTNWLLPELIKELLPFASGITALTGTSPQLLESLAKREIDCAFVTGSFAEVQGVSRTLIFEDEAVIVMPESMAQKHAGRWSWNDLRFCGLPFIRFVREGGGGRLNESFMSTLGFEFPQRIEVDNNATMLSLVEKGVGWGIVVSSVFLQHPEARSRVHVEALPESGFRHGIYLISREREMPQMIERIAGFARKAAENREG